MSEDIIDFYKKTKKEDTIPEEVVVPIEESVPAPVADTTSDPFQNFLHTLADNIKKTKASEFTEKVKPLEESTTNDPFHNFLTNVADIIKKDEKIQTDEQIKEATIDFINKLKTEDVVEKPIEQPVVKKQKTSYLPSKFLKKLPKKVVKEEVPLTKALPSINLETGTFENEQPIEEVKDVVEEVKEEAPVEDNSYVKQLKASDKLKKSPTKPGDIKTLIEKQVREQINKLRQELGQVAMTAGGGGTVAVQYADGGTMNGDLNVTGKYLSGGRDLASIFSSGGGGGGSSDRLVAGGEQLLLNIDGSITFPDNVIRPTDDTVITLESENTALSAFTRVTLSPYAFFAYDANSNSVTFDSIDNTVTLTTLDQYEWKFNDQGELVGPGNVLTVNSTLSTVGRILSGGRDLSDIFITQATDSQTLTYDPSSYLLAISNGNTVSLATLSSTPINLSFLSVSGNWNTSYDVATAYQNVSSTLVTNTQLQSTSALLTPLTVTSTLTSQLVLNNDFNNYQTNVGSATATLLPTTAYRTTSGTFITTVSGTANQINAVRVGSAVTLSLPNSAVFPGDVSIIGNLNIAGSATYVNTQNLVVGDNLIYLNNNNYGSNVLDTGFVSHFTQAPLGYNHTGLVRRAGQGIPGVWTLFSGLTTEPASAANIDWSDKNLVIDSLSANILGNLSGSYVSVGNGNSDQWNSAYASTTALNLTASNWNAIYNAVSTYGPSWQNASDALDYIIVNSNFNIIANRKYIVDTSTARLTGTLPASPVIGDNVLFVDSDNNWGIRPLIIYNNGNLIQTYNEPLTANISGYQFQLVYVGGLNGWKII